jgi:molybdenum cofactor guanylyltransferase
MEMQPHPVTGVILAGGKSRRMGQNKAFLKIDGAALIETTCLLFKHLFQETLLITHEEPSYQHLGIPVHEDILPQGGPLAGLHAGIYYAKFPHVFAAGCDMPFLNARVIEYQLGLRGRYDVVVPKTVGGLEPLHAVYSKACLCPIETILRKKKSRAIAFFPLVRVRVIRLREVRLLDPDLKTFINLNTPEEVSLHLGACVQTSGEGIRRVVPKSSQV